MDMLKLVVENNHKRHEYVFQFEICSRRFGQAQGYHKDRTEERNNYDNVIHMAELYFLNTICDKIPVLIYNVVI
jgi:hypothetical protein